MGLLEIAEEFSNRFKQNQPNERIVEVDESCFWGPENKDLIKWFIDVIPFLPESPFYINSYERWNSPVIMYRHLHQVIRQGPIAQ